MRIADAETKNTTAMFSEKYGDVVLVDVPAVHGVVRGTT